MSTVRRLYFYGLSLISAEVVIWGVINLLRTIASRGLVGGGGSLLASGLSLVIVGLPIFWLHWRTVQRDTQRDPEEHASRVRAIFFYAALSATLGPILFSALALISRWLVMLLGQTASTAWLGGGGTAVDNLISILINAIALAYFWLQLRADWQSYLPENFLAETRRLFRYAWVLVGLTLTVTGVYNLLYYLLATLGQTAEQMAATLAGGVSLLVVGAPLWAYFWWTAQSSLADPAERKSLLRLVVLYLISLAGVVGVLTPVGEVLSALFRWILGESTTLVTFLRDNSGYIAAAIPLGIMWWYYGRILNEEVAAMPDQPRREALDRLYYYILSALGLAVTFIGLINLVNFLAQVIITREPVVGSLSSMLSSSLAALLIGLPLWLIPWNNMQREAARRDDAGDRARRSVLRRTYLYLVLFLLVIGAMVFTGQLLYTLLNGLLSGEGQTLALDATTQFLSLVIDAALLLYHWRVLRQDGRLAQQTLGDLHAAFPTLILLEGDGTLGDALIQAFQREAPRLPVAVHPVEHGAPDEAMLGVKAVLIPLGLALKPLESLRLWLEEFQGQRILIPIPTPGWFWLGQSEKRALDLARETARAIRQIAEGESVRQSLPNSPWAIAGYVLGGIFGVLLLFLTFSLMISTLFR